LLQITGFIFCANGIAAASLFRRNQLHLLESHPHRRWRDPEFRGQTFHSILSAQFAFDRTLLGESEPASPDFRKRHQEFCRKGPGLAFVEDSTFLESPMVDLPGAVLSASWCPSRTWGGGSLAWRHSREVEQGKRVPGHQLG